MNQLALSFAPSSGGRTVLAERKAGYPFSVTTPISRKDGAAQLTLQSISGGLYGGECITQHIHVRPGASARLIQPTATTVRRADTTPARQSIRLEAGENAALVYAARPLIMLPGAALAQDWEIILAQGARLMFWDAFVSHSPNGETPAWSLTSRVNLRAANGSLLAAERIAVKGAELGEGFQGVVGDFSAFGKFWRLGPGPVENPVRSLENIQNGFTRLPGEAGCVIALAARDGGALCAAMETILNRFEEMSP
ncbi:MAG: urease accessory protein UreD [Proteobacteria bacterium]|nr:urease accessory protein UreD [Pseudomonadota bacterium]